MRRALWPLPLLAALLPLLATVAAYRLSLAADLVPGCNPFIEGCVSISRAARHGLGNIVFRALVIPAAVLQAAVWMIAPAWLHRSGNGKARALRWLPWLGLAAGASLVLYAAFLGTEGEGYRLMRRYGTAVYFGFSCIGMLIVAGKLQRLPASGRADRLAARITLGLCLALPLLGLAHVLLPLALPSAATKDALENATEWWGAAIFTLFFLTLARAWHATGFAARFDTAAEDHASTGPTSKPLP